MLAALVSVLCLTLFTPTIPETPNEKIFDQWGDLLVEHFDLEDMELITQIIWCESRGKETARNPKGSAGGLFQIIKKTAQYVAPKVGKDPSTEQMKSGIRFNAYWNVRMSAWLFYKTPQGVGHWNESKSCWRNYET